MRRSSLISTVAATVLVVAGAAAVDTPAFAHAAGRTPAPVTQVRAYDDRHAVEIEWTNPSRHFDHVAVRLRRGPDAPGYRHGGYQGRNVRHNATTARLTHLRRDTVYSVTIWTVSAHGIRSASRHAHFTTDGGQGGAGTYTARFTDASGHPLAGVIAQASSLGTGLTRTATSGRNGRISLSLAAGGYGVDVDGANATGGSSDPTGYVGTDRVVSVKAGRTRQAGAIRLAAGGAIRVHVVDAAGRPMRGVQPELAPVSTYVEPDEGSVFFGFEFVESSSGAQRTDADGDATLKGVTRSGAVQVCVNPYDTGFGDPDSNFLSACTTSTRLPRAGATVSAGTLTVQRLRGGTVVGRVRNSAGHGLGTSLVLAVRGRQLVGAAYSSGSGAFRIEGLRPGAYRVCAVEGTFSQLGRTGYQPGCGKHAVTVASSSATATTSVVLHPGAAVTGTVTGPNGVAVPGADIQLGRAGGAYGESGARGHFLIKGLPAGRHTLCAEALDLAPSKRLPYGVRSACGHKSRLHFTAQIGRVRTGLDVHLKVGGAASGTVRDKLGRPVPFTEVIALPKADVSGEPALATTDSRGHFTLTGLRTSHYRVCTLGLSGGSLFTAFATSGGNGGSSSASANGASGCNRGAVSVRAGHRTGGVKIVLPTTSAVRVHAVDQHGRGVAGVDATVVQACGRFCGPGTPLLPRSRTSVVATATTDRTGTALLDGLQPGKYAVCLFAFYGTTTSGAPSNGYADRCSGKTFTVVVRAGKTTSTRLVLSPAGAVSGRITDANGQPLQGVLVHVAGSAADDIPAEDTEFTDESDSGVASVSPGYYSTTGADGTYTVRSVRAGHQLVCVDPTGAKGGTSSAGYVAQCVGGTPGSTAKGTPVTVRSGATTGGVDLALTAAGGISGHLTSRLRRASTTLVLFRGQKFVSNTDPDAVGGYQFADVTPGTYTVCAVAFTRSVVRGRCYRDAAWNPKTARGPAAGATPIEVASGSTTSGIDIVVPR